MHAAIAIDAVLDLGQRVADRHGLADSGDIAEIRAQHTAAPFHHVATVAAALAEKHRAAARHVTRQRRVQRGAAQGMDIGAQTG